MGKGIRERSYSLLRVEIKGLLYPYVTLTAVIDEIENAQEVEVGCVVPFVGQ
jgi:hypothetical protein